MGIKRKGNIHLYSAPAPARTYLMYNNELLDWVVDRLNNQQTDGILGYISDLIRLADYPTSMWIMLGAGEYTEWGQKNFIEVGDECLVVIYDETVHTQGPTDVEINGLFSDQLSP